MLAPAAQTTGGRPAPQPPPRRRRAQCRRRAAHPAEDVARGRGRPTAAPVVDERALRRPRSAGLPGLKGSL